MLHKLYLAVLSQSFMASYVIIAVLLGRFILKKANQPTIYALWLVVLLRLALPFTWENPFSQKNLTQEGGNPSQSSQHSEFIPNFPLIPEIENFRPTESTGETPSPTQSNEQESPENTSFDLFHVTFILWIGGMVVMCLVFMASSLKIQSKIRYSSKLEGNIYLVDHMKTSFVWGLVKPKIYLPSSLNEEDKSYILVHEQEHIKRFDHLTRIFAYILLSIHWFNPFVWIAYHVAGKDMELSIDERVLSKNSENIIDYRQKYAETLLRHATKDTWVSPLAFGKRGVKERIVNIMKTKKRSRFLLGIVTMITLGTLVACSSKPSENQGDSEQHQVADHISPALTSVTVSNSHFGLSLEIPTFMEQVEADYHHYSGVYLPETENEPFPYRFIFETKPDISQQEAMEDWINMIQQRDEWGQIKLDSGDFSSFTTDNGAVFEFAYAIVEEQFYWGVAVDSSVEPPFRQLHLMAIFLLDDEQIYFNCRLEVEPEFGNSDENVQFQYDFLLEQVESMKEIAKTFQVDEKGLTSSAIPMEFSEID